MFKWISKLSPIIASLALMVTAASQNLICFCWMYQPEMPEGAESLRRK